MPHHRTDPRGEAARVRRNLPRPGKGRFRAVFVALAAALCLFGSMAAAQQTKDATGHGDCTAPAPAAPNGQGSDAGGRNSLSDCNGVLTPPPVGDKDIVTPAPPVGDTPVIRPNAVPSQPVSPAENGSRQEG
ncbi:hypothetical protein SAMN05880590_101754 [Rhizobium sp. RU35A]|nr:hypothetical protein SAMN05880590_101754 [Rhizobium sp. RU35A]